MSDTPPTRAEWQRPAIEFDTEKDRQRFQQVLVDTRDYYLRASESFPAGEIETLNKLVNTLESMLDEMGTESDPTAAFVFETPAQVTAAMKALEFVAQAVKESAELSAEKKEQSMQNMAEMAALVTEAHWRDDPLCELKPDD